VPQEIQRRGRRGGDAIYFDHRGQCRDPEHHRHCPGRWRGAVSRIEEGKRVRRKVSGRTKSEVKDRLKALHEELDQGVKPSASYKVADALTDWLEHGLDGRSPKTLSTYREVTAPLLPLLGAIPLRDLTAADVRAALTRTGATRSSRTVTIAHQVLTRAIRHAEANDLVRRNVASLIRAPKGGTPGRPSRALNLGQAAALLEAARRYRLRAYVVLSLTTGIRSEEARALRWDHVDLDAGTISVWRSVRAHGDVKTRTSRRTLALPEMAVQALREHQELQRQERLNAGPLWQEHGLVFASTLGTPLDRSHVRRSLRLVSRIAGIGEDWAPRDLRHTFVSIMSAHGDVPVEEIARLTGHSDIRTTETVYRHELRPVIRTGAGVMDRLLGNKAEGTIGTAAG
jgi:integrase